MKIIYTVSLFLFLCLKALAQPVLTGSNINFSVGQSFLLHTYNLASFSPGASGANVTWNFANIGNTANATMTMVTPSSTPFGAQFTAANVAYSVTGVTGNQYFLADNNELSQCGATNGTSAIVYQNREQILSYPCNFNSTGTDNFSSVFQSAGYTYHRSGTSSFTADGYGTLIMPYGTVNNVMRVRFIEDYQDSTNISGFPFIIPYHNDEYMWFKPGVHSFILVFYTLTANGSPVQAGFYLDQVSVGVSDPSSALTGYMIYPNPSSDKLFINYDVKENTKVEVRLLNLMGQVVKTIADESRQPGTYTEETEVSNLAKGNYIVQITEGGQSSKKIITVK
jgi:hypothetical protein